jgi:hypothetical protein
MKTFEVDDEVIIGSEKAYTKYTSYGNDHEIWITPRDATEPKCVAIISGDDGTVVTAPSKITARVNKTVAEIGETPTSVADKVKSFFNFGQKDTLGFAAGFECSYDESTEEFVSLVASRVKYTYDHPPTLADPIEMPYETIAFLTGTDFSLMKKLYMTSNGQSYDSKTEYMFNYTLKAPTIMFDGTLTNVYTKAEVDAKIPDIDSSSIIQTTTIEGYDPNMIGCFCMTTNAQNSSNSPIVKVKRCDAFDSNMAKLVIGIIVAENKVITHGPVFCRMFDSSDPFQVGDTLVPNYDGNMAATEDELETIIKAGMPRVKITSLDSKTTTYLLTCFIH